MLLDLSANTSSLTCGITCISAAIFVIVKLSRPSKLRGIPTVGSSTWLGSWWAGFTYLTNALEVVQEGYHKHKSAPFKVAELGHWTVVLSNRKHVEEMRKSPDDTFSVLAARIDTLQIEYTLGAQLIHRRYQKQIVRSHWQLTRNIGVLHPEIRDEIIASFGDILDLTGSEWKSVPARGTVHKVICRTNNRVFVGLPLCRDPDWIDLNIQYTISVAKKATIMRLFPGFLKPIVSRFFTSTEQSNECGRKLLGPIIEERQKFRLEYGNDWVDKPNDFLSWLMDDAEGSELSTESLTTYILSVNFAATHTASHNFTSVLLYLAENPQYVKPLREEVEGIVGNEGWSQAALGKMWKVDSFIKECQRLDGITTLGMKRKALKDFTFSDGTFVPKGTNTIVAIQCIHHSEAFYENPNTFKPFRFSDLREKDNLGGEKYQLATTTPEYLVFGHGRDACPGRFFLASELKTMLAHIVVTYDVKFADNTTRPPSLHFGELMMPDPNAKVMFRRRVD